MPIGTAQEYMARVLTRDELAEVVACAIERDGSLYFYCEFEGPCLAMLDGDDQLVLWANGLRKIPFLFQDTQDFLDFCGEIEVMSSLDAVPREQPEMQAYIEPNRIRRFRSRTA